MLSSIPRIGLGTWKSPNSDVVTDAVKAAIKAGYRHIDCAQGYANHDAVGRGIRDCIDAGIIRREEIWVTSKLPPHMHETVEKGARLALKELGLTYLDLYLIHTPVAFPQGDNPWPTNADGTPIIHAHPVVDTWRDMTQLVPKKLCRHVGVSNFNIELLEKLRYAPDVTMQPYANQIELHPQMQQGAMIDYLQKRGIYLTGYSPFGSPDSKEGQRSQSILKDRDVAAIAEQLRKSPGQVVLRYLLSLSPVVGVIPKSVTPERIKQNIELNFELTLEQAQIMRSKEKHLRLIGTKQDWGVDMFGDSF